MTSDRSDSINILNHWDLFIPEISASIFESNYAKLWARSIYYSILIGCLLASTSESDMNCYVLTETKSVSGLIGTREVLMYDLYLCSLPRITQSKCLITSLTSARIMDIF